MNFLLPLGFLGLIGLVILILIHILKPNYQDKFLSSTYIWKLSLKYKKRKLPINMLRNILLLICQILIITACAAILARPVIPAEELELVTDKVVIIDASASMQGVDDSGVTRFERAVDQVTQQGREVLAGGGTVTVIIASDVPYYSSNRQLDIDEFVLQQEALLEPVANGAVSLTACTYREADIDTAVSMAESTLVDIPSAQLLFYTATHYADVSEDVTVVNVSTEDEWNAAIVNAECVMEGNFQQFNAVVASYNIPMALDITIEVEGVGLGVGNGVTSIFTEDRTVFCSANEMYDVLFETVNGVSIVSYDSVRIHIQNLDALAVDNDFYLYGGTKSDIRVQYASSAPTIFVESLLYGMQDEMNDMWDIHVDKVLPGDTVEVSGYDFYVFEYEMPLTLPTDGVVLLISPNSDVGGLPIKIGEKVAPKDPMSLILGDDEHPIMDGIDPTSIFVKAYTRLYKTDGFSSLMECGGGDSVFLIKDTQLEKIMVLSFGTDLSDVSVNLAYPLLIRNMFFHFFPETLESNVYNVGDTVPVNARGAELYIDGAVSHTLDTFPNQFVVPEPGTYSLSQTWLSGETVEEHVYVKIVDSESNFSRVDYTVISPIIVQEPEPVDYDLLMWFALALVVLLFAEWWLHNRQQS